MSIELCDTTGEEASSVLMEKLRDPSLPVKIGGGVLDHILGISHSGDGLIVASYSDDSGESSRFQFAPTHEPFADTAMDDDGQPICIGRKDK